MRNLVYLTTPWHWNHNLKLSNNFCYTEKTLSWYTAKFNWKFFKNCSALNAWYLQMRILSIFLTVTVYRLALMEKRKTVISYNVKMKLKSSFHNIVPLTKKIIMTSFFQLLLTPFLKYITGIVTTRLHKGFKT